MPVIDTTKLIIVGAAAFAIAASATWWSVHQYNKGYSAAVAAIAAQDKEAVDAINVVRDTMRECRATGGVWSQAGGVCQRR